MELSYLEEFLVFSRYLNVSEAARKLHFSQPTLSNHLAALEKEVGVPLINHASQPLSLTQAGHVLVRGATTILDAYRQVMGDVKEAAQSAQELRMYYAPTQSAPHIALQKIVYGFKMANPNVFIRPCEARHATVREYFAQEDVDCVAVYLSTIQSDIDAGICFREIPFTEMNHVCVWTDKNSELAHLDSVHWNDLAPYVYPMPESYFKLWVTASKQFMKDRGIFLPMPPFTESAPDFLSSIKPNEIQLYDEAYQQQLLLNMDTSHVLVPIDEPDAVTKLFIAYKPDRVSPALETFLHYLDKQEAK